MFITQHVAHTHACCYVILPRVVLAPLPPLLPPRPPLQVVVGNWEDASLLQGQRFDTILADYLIGSINLYSPYFQVRTQLRWRTRP
jgi:hypothetical protein